MKKYLNIKRNSSKGSITIYLLIIVVIIGAIYMAGGIFPSLEPIDIGEEQQVVVVDEEQTEATGAARDSLRLRTIEFEPCAGSAAVTLQLDITGSMAVAIGDLKQAVYTFTDQLTDNSVIGIQAYSTRDPRLEVIPVQLYSEARDDIEPEVGRLRADGRTPTYEALQFSREILQQAISEYPDRDFSYIFFSDGNPNEGPRTIEDISQAAQEIKDLGVTVYAIGLTGITGLNENIINSIASSPDTAHTTDYSEELEAIYSEISTDICDTGGANQPSEE